MYTPIYECILKKRDSIFTRRPVFYDGSARSIVPLLRRYLGTPDREHYAVILLDTQNAVIGINTVGIGNLTSVSSPCREILKPAILSSAYSIITCHTHPDGNPSPSDADRKHYARMFEICTHMAILLEDNIILADGAYFSFAEENSRQCAASAKRQREQAVSKAKRRIDSGTNCYRDVALLAADRLAELAKMTQTEATDALERIIVDLSEIAETKAKIRKTTRRRADDLLQFALEMESTGNYFQMEKLASLTEWGDPEPKPCTMPLVDFIELPGDRRKRK